MKNGVAVLIESMTTLKDLGDPPESNIIFVGIASEGIDYIGSKKLWKKDLLIMQGLDFSGT